MYKCSNCGHVMVSSEGVCPSCKVHLYMEPGVSEPSKPASWTSEELLVKGFFFVLGLILAVVALVCAIGFIGVYHEKSIAKGYGLLAGVAFTVLLPGFLSWLSFRKARKYRS